MFEQNDDRDRGQVGIGTLIVFIAMVLVAAIAAGVLINTAGMLQTQAEATGEESTDQVSDRLDIVSVSGDVDDPDDPTQINNISMVTATAPGSDPVDLNQTTAQFIGEGGEEMFNLSHEGVFINSIQGVSDEPDNNVLTESSDRAEVVFELDGAPGSYDIGYEALDESERLTVILTTDAGASTEQEIRVPSTFIEDEESVRL
ncbi:flagellin B1 [Natrialba magadii ATCC 43099]|uniref:Flagellin B1 n=2 Tax=Natrialba magadii (strain ATCC 43099 / DSM 3394 / CCM 3739 / CIP 104546 / IAM 13178 / JCM 8861 / NBRC 102185 / NCIMB 2190 / MS3) TaxID=547559 RepID=FLAB1_NATMM|nr:flagellin B1 [Natrialba magadii]Q9P9I3.2 RecName: Full=Flagellin B1; Flags: Precursor [Natrialba magadii ATCC 43099]ADD06415.1 flagellin B1 [Natrialba magadii ATCC 43099]ELY31698.1 flagellin [Natrialba magadii ATCC 43099]